MKVSDLRLDVEKDLCRLSAALGEERVHFTVHGQTECHATGDAFVMLALIPSMERGEPLVVDERIPVSASLVRRLRTYQEIYVQWFPHLSLIPIEAPNTEVPTPAAASRVGCFFSGGVDSVYSVVRNQDDITDLVLCRGLDIPFNEVERWEQTVAAVQGFADSVGKRLLLLESDAKARFRSPHTDNHGAVLISSGIPIGFQRLIVPASYTYNSLFPWGSHPLLDPLLSTDATEVEHDGAQSRTHKTRMIASSPTALAQLRVCNSFAKFNCGTCEKCLRTMTVLSMLGVRSEMLPEMDVKTLSRLKLEKPNTVVFWTENLDMARELGRADFEQAIADLLRRYKRREKLREIDRQFLGEAGIKTFRSLRGRR